MDLFQDLTTARVFLIWYLLTVPFGIWWSIWAVIKEGRNRAPIWQEAAGVLVFGPTMCTVLTMMLTVAWLATRGVWCWRAARKTRTLQIPLCYIEAGFYYVVSWSLGAVIEPVRAIAAFVRWIRSRLPRRRSSSENGEKRPRAAA